MYKGTKNNWDCQVFPRLFSHKNTTQTKRNGSRWLPFLYSHLWGTGTHTQPCRNKSKKFWRKYLEYCPSCCIFAMSI